MRLPCTINNFQANYKKILEFLRTEKENFINQIRKSKLSDIELISLNFTAEYLGIDNECQLLLYLLCMNQLV